MENVVPQRPEQRVPPAKLHMVMFNKQRSKRCIIRELEVNNAGIDFTSFNIVSHRRCENQNFIKLIIRVDETVAETILSNNKGKLCMEFGRYANFSRIGEPRQRPAAHDALDIHSHSQTNYFVRSSGLVE